ncbi:putative adenylyltransferase/sulfurtransferase MoeZ [Bacteroidales bacterium Barb4]|nr:putative adenylyltransferase/sulfurtransferase MoeZ [Bacteroidales bacterium Barb4]
MTDFTDKQIERYSRHILLQDIGAEGQEKICNGKVLVVGAGGLGSPVLLYLAAAGVGTLGVIDGDTVDLSNLQRQVIHFTPDTGKPKVISAKEKINRLNPDVNVIACHERLTAGNALDIIKDYDFIVDGTDNFPVKFLINDACVLAGKPFSHGGILRFEGQTLTHLPGTACYRCLFHSPPPPDAAPSCSQSGVLGAVAGMLGTIQAAEVLKFLTGTGELLTNRLLTFNAKTMHFQTITLKKNPNCPVCGAHPTITELTATDGRTACTVGLKSCIPSECA